MNSTLVQLGRVIAVTALLICAALLATPKGRLPLALRGVYRILRRDRGLDDGASGDCRPSSKRRLLAFFLVLLAIVLSLVNFPS